MNTQRRRQNQNLILLWEEEGFIQDDSQGPGSETRWTVGLLIEVWNLGRMSTVRVSVLGFRCAVKRRAKIESGGESVYVCTHTNYV